MGLVNLQKKNQARQGWRTPSLSRLVLFLMTGILAACGSPSKATPQRPVNTYANAASEPTSTMPPATGDLRPLPSFSDWRATYIGPDGRLRAVSLDGAHDDAGAALPIQGFGGDGVFTPGTSPDGGALAYFSDARLTVVDPRVGTTQTYHVHVGDSALAWSPDGRALALNGAGAIVTVGVADGTSDTEPPRKGAPPPIAVSAPYGWLDSTHVAVEDLLHSTATSARLASLDVTNGKMRPIASLNVDGGAQFSVTPDRKSVLFWNARYRGNLYTPQAALIDSSSGKVTPLPHTTAALTTYGFIDLLWRPNTTQALAVTIQPGSSNFTYLLLDVAKDSVTPLTLPAYPEAWSPDGSTLLLAAQAKASITEDTPGFNDIGALGAGPFTLSAISVDSAGKLGQSVTLTTRAMDIPTLGFVRTA